MSPPEMLPVPLLRILPQSRWSFDELIELWRFRDLLRTLAERDVKLRYRQTALGVLWVIIQPLFAAGIFTFVFGRMAKLPSDGIPYFVFSYAGLLGWNAFSATMSKASASLVGNAQLVSKVYFPRLILPLSTVLSTLLDFTIGLIFMIPIFFYFHVVPSWNLLLLPFWLFLTVSLAAGTGFFLSALTVSYRDVQYILPVLIQFMVYATPVGYSVSAMPPELRRFITFNPLSAFLEGFRSSLLNTSPPPLIWIVYSAGFTLFVCIIGTLVFRQMETRFADVI